MWSRPSILLAGAATLAYPFLVYAALGRLEPYWLALVLVGVVVLRAWASRQAVWLLAGLGVVMLALSSAWIGSWLPLKLYPVLVSCVFLLVFGASILRPPTVIERIARLADPALPAAAIPYTRAVTQVWCIFFVVNGLAALATTLWASDEVWVLYNGLIAYILMGLLFAGEWWVRRRVRARLAENLHV